MLSKFNEKTEWDLEDSLFIDVAPICLFLDPYNKISNASLYVDVTYSDKASTYTPFFKSSLN